MGAIGDALVRFAQPLIDGTDGSPEQLRKAFSLAQLCWNLAVTSEERRDALLAQMQPDLNMDDGEFKEFKSNIVFPMILRHRELFPGMHQKGAMAPSRRAPSHAIPPSAPPRLVKKYAGTGRNAPCPCGSRKKYKVCCGR